MKPGEGSFKLCRLELARPALRAERAARRHASLRGVVRIARRLGRLGLQRWQWASRLVLPNYQGLQPRELEPMKPESISETPEALNSDTRDGPSVDPSGQRVRGLAHV